MAQVSSVLVFSDEGRADRLAFFLGIDRARFRRQIVPGDQIVIDVEMIHQRRNACKVKATARVDDDVAAEADMMFGIMDSAEEQDV
jgi:3-hydroxyacyl-[acyl-carrier-protein] dehydratase